MVGVVSCILWSVPFFFLLYFIYLSFRFAPRKKGKKIIFIFLITFGWVYSFSVVSSVCILWLRLLFAVACSVELRSYGGLARRGTLSTFVPIQFAAPVFILSIIKYAPARARSMRT